MEQIQPAPYIHCLLSNFLKWSPALFVLFNKQPYTQHYNYATKHTENETLFLWIRNRHLQPELLAMSSNQSINHSFIQSVSQSVSQSVNRSVNQSVNSLIKANLQKKCITCSQFVNRIVQRGHWRRTWRKVWRSSPRCSHDLLAVKNKGGIIREDLLVVHCFGWCRCGGCSGECFGMSSSIEREFLFAFIF